jgi:dTDP-glucose 4,6-dehydratase
VTSERPTHDNAFPRAHDIRDRRCRFHWISVVRHLLDDTEAFVLNIDTLTYASNLNSIPHALKGDPRYGFAQVDICDAPALRALFERYQPHAVMNLAAESHVDRSIDGPAEFIQTNVVGTFTLLQEALRYWRLLGSERRASFRFLHVSTDEVFGSLGPDGVLTETSSKCAEFSLRRQQGIIGPPCARLARDL